MMGSELESFPNYNYLFNLLMFDENANAVDNGGLGSVVGQGPAQRKAGPSVLLQGRKRRRRRAKVGCKNKEVAETQRMTHITVERNRRRLMNDHLAVLRSLMPESYAQRGDQASIVGGAIEFVKELEHLVHSLEAQKLLLLHRPETQTTTTFNTKLSTSSYLDHQCPSSNKYTFMSNADIEVTLIESHASIRILTKKTHNQLSKLVSGFQTLCLTVLHLSVTSLDPLLLFSISAKVEEGCQLKTVDNIAEAVHQMLRIIEEDASSFIANILAT